MPRHIDERAVLAKMLDAHEELVRALEAWDEAFDNLPDRLQAGSLQLRPEDELGEHDDHTLEKLKHANQLHLSYAAEQIKEAIDAHGAEVRKKLLALERKLLTQAL